MPIACVEQPFSGPIEGNGLLLLEKSAALPHIVGVETSTGDSAAALEAVMKVGNILLNGCLGVFDRLFGAGVIFAVPKVSVLKSGHSFPVGVGGALLVQTRVTLSQDAVTAYLVVMPRPSSLSARSELSVTHPRIGHRVFWRRAADGRRWMPRGRDIPECTALPVSGTGPPRTGPCEDKSNAVAGQCVTNVDGEETR